MENQIDTARGGITIFKESGDASGFVIREMLKTHNQNLRFQAGHYVMVPMKLPAYKTVRRVIEGKERDFPLLTHHVDGDDIRKFKLEGYGPTLLDALNHASETLLRKQADFPSRCRE